MVENIQLPLNLHHVAIDGIFEPDGRVRIEMREPAFEERYAASLVLSRRFFSLPEWDKLAIETINSAHFVATA
jgi:hypothetical protein